MRLRFAMPRILLAIALLVVGVPGGVPGGEAAAPAAEPDGAGGRQRLVLRVGEHPEYSRLVFDWPASVDYRVDEGEEGFRLHFDRPAELDLSRYRAGSLSRVTGIEPRSSGTGLQIEVTTAGRASVRHFLDGTHVVVDVMNGGEAPADEGHPEPESAESESAEAEALSRPVGPAPHAPLGSGVTRAAAEPPTSLPAPVAEAVVAVLGQADGGDLLPAPGDTLAMARPLRLRFDWSTPAPRAAAFRRGRHLWVIFDGRAPDGLAGRIAEAAPEVAPVERFSARNDPDATVLRMVLPPAMAPTLTREARVWTIELRRRTDEPEAGVSLEIGGELEAESVVPHLLFRAGGSTGPLRIQDPDLGDSLLVFPVETPGLGVRDTRSFPRFMALATYQGVVVQPLSDGLRAEVVGIGVKVTHAEGLLVSSHRDRARAAALEPDRGTGVRLFDLAAWRRSGEGRFAEVKQALLSAIVESPPDEVDIARLDLARFYFAHGLATESLAVLRLISQENRRLTIDPQVLLLRAAGAFLMGDLERAAESLADAALEGEWEAAPWHGAVAAAARDWAVAVESFAAADPLLTDYDRRTRAKLRLLAAEARLGIGDSGGASFYLEELRQDSPTRAELAQLEYLDGRRRAMDGDMFAAREIWSQVAAGRHRPSQARARLALIDLDMEEHKLTAEAAIDELERLRFAWRGDDLELDLIERLAMLYAELGDYRKTLTALRQAASYLTRFERAEEIGQRMGELFIEIYLGERGARLPPLTALALFEEFKELTPAGHGGDLVIAQLADRLVEVDLLDQAAGVLEDQVAYRLKGEEKARVGARLALVRLLDRKPDAALAALEASEPAPAEASLSEPLKRRRRHLRARAMVELDRVPEALSLLDGDDSRDALSLRAEIFWTGKDWEGAAEALSALAPPPPAAGEALGETEVEVVLNLAVAYSLAGWRDALRDLGARYAAAMSGTASGASFELLTGDLDAEGAATISGELAGVGRFRSFMSSYRERLQQASLSALD